MGNGGEVLDKAHCPGCEWPSCPGSDPVSELVDAVKELRASARNYSPRIDERLGAALQRMEDGNG